MGCRQQPTKHPRAGLLHLELCPPVSVCVCSRREPSKLCNRKTHASTERGRKAYTGTWATLGRHPPPGPGAAGQGAAPAPVGGHTRLRPQPCQGTLGGSSKAGAHAGLPTRAARCLSRTEAGKGTQRLAHKCSFSPSWTRHLGDFRAPETGSCARGPA